MMFDNHLATVT